MNANNVTALSSAASKTSSGELSDVTNARAFAKKYKSHACFVPQIGKWFFYRDHAWQQDNLNQIMQLSIDVTQDMVAQAAQLLIQATREIDKDKRTALLSKATRLTDHARKSQQKPRLDAMVSLATTEPSLAVSQDKLDDEDMLIGVRNGVIDLKTGQFRGGRPEDWITKQAGCEYKRGWEDMECPTWLHFLEVVQPDPNIRAWLQRFVGYCLTGSTSEQFVTIFHGTGANGKSVFIEVIRRLLGDYARVVQFDTFTEKKKDSIRNDLAALDKVRVAVATEGSETARLDEGLVKQLTGSDPVTARFLHREFFTYTPRYKIILTTNHKPVIVGTDHGIWRRVVLVPFPVTILKEQQDKGLLDKLTDELPDILSWALKGLADYLEVGLELPAAIKNATREYKDASDLVGQWLEDCCEIDKYRWESNTDLYSSYSAWAKDGGYRAMSDRTLKERLKEKGLIKPGKNNGARGWVGLRLNPIR